MTMRKYILAAAAAALLSMTASADAQNKSGVNIGSLNCTVAGGIGFIFGSSKALDCIFAGNDGKAEHYSGTVKKFGVDIGFTKESHIIWLVFAPGAVVPGALAGDYAGGTGGASIGAGGSVNALIGGGSKNIQLQPVSVEGTVGLNVAAGVMAVELKAAAK
jgi:hypothetical protein